MSEQQREELPIDVLFIGGGPASLAGAIHLKRESKKNNLDLEIAVIEKANEIGSHSLSGAIIDPKSLIELFPNLNINDFPFEAPVGTEKMFFLTKSKLKLSHVGFSPRNNFLGRKTSQPVHYLVQ